MYVIMLLVLLWFIIGAYSYIWYFTKIVQIDLVVADLCTIFVAGMFAPITLITVLTFIPWTNFRFLNKVIFRSK